MTRVLTLGLLAAAALGMTALAPTAASAHGWGWGHHHHFFGGPAFIVNDDGCLVRQLVETRRGPRVRLVNVCGY
jgi:Spy/CpxP family protein refolding chaperone